MPLEENTQRPPIGIEPIFVHEENRLISIRDAIVRRLNVNNEMSSQLYHIPLEWIIEYNELLLKSINRRS